MEVEPLDRRVSVANHARVAGLHPDIPLIPSLDQFGQKRDLHGGTLCRREGFLLGQLVLASLVQGVLHQLAQHKPRFVPGVGPGVQRHVGLPNSTVCIPAADLDQPVVLVADGDGHCFGSDVVVRPARIQKATQPV